MYSQLLKAVNITLVTFLLLAVSVASDGRADVASGRPWEGSFVPTEILIGLEPELAQRVAGQRVTPGQTGIVSLDGLNRRYAVQQISPVFPHLDLGDPVAIQHGLAGVFKLTVPAGTDIWAMIEKPQAADLPYMIYLPLVSKMRTTLGRLNAYQALLTLPGGQVSAPEDDCSSEPDCPSDCGAEVVLSGESTALNDLHLLRTFRDRVLAPSPLGRHWITLYQHHRLETAWILMSDEPFRTQTRLALKQWLPLFQALTYPDSVPDQRAILTSEQAEALEAVMAGLAERGSPRLRSDLGEVRETLQVERFVGWDVRHAWRELDAGQRD